METKTYKKQNETTYLRNRDGASEPTEKDKSKRHYTKWQKLFKILRQKVRMYIILNSILRLWHNLWWQSISLQDL